MSEFAGDFAEDAELRAMLSDLDPMSARVPVESHTSPRARHHLEQIMTTEITDSTESPAPSTSRFRGRGTTWLAAAAAVAAIAIGTTVLVSAHDGDDPGIVAAPTVLALQGTTGGGLVMGSCLAFDVNELAKEPVAFAGTVTAITPQQVTLDVDHWYKGGNADEVTVATPPGQTSAALDGVNWEQGARYLISAFDGTVVGCGFSGPATPEFEKQFDQAFPAGS